MIWSREGLQERRSVASVGRSREKSVQTLGKESPVAKLRERCNLSSARAVRALDGTHSVHVQIEEVLWPREGEGGTGGRAAAGAVITVRRGTAKRSLPHSSAPPENTINSRRSSAHLRAIRRYRKKCASFEAIEIAQRPLGQAIARIVGGVPVISNEFPDCVLVGRRRANGNFDWFCTGVPTTRE